MIPSVARTRPGKAERQAQRERPGPLSPSTPINPARQGNGAPGHARTGQR